MSMVISSILKSDYTDFKLIYDNGNESKYYIRVFPIEDGGLIRCVEGTIVKNTGETPTVEDFKEYENMWINTRKKQMVHKITEYDKSKSVNHFFINGIETWLDKATRVGLVNSTNSEVALGFENTTMWFNGIELTIPCVNALHMLRELEVYAKTCYNQTEYHKNEVNSLSTLEEVETYDYTLGYPDAPEFTVEL